MKVEFEAVQWDVDYTIEGKQRFESREAAESLATELNAREEKMAELQAELNMVSERMEELVSVALAAARDIAEWQQLARYQREKSSNPNHDPLCATEAAIESSEQIKKDLYRAAFGQDSATALSAKGEINE